MDNNCNRLIPSRNVSCDDRYYFPGNSITGISFIPEGNPENEEYFIRIDYRIYESKKIKVSKEWYYAALMNLKAGHPISLPNEYEF